MKIFKGKPISLGYAEGRAVVYRSGHGVAARRRRIRPEQVAREIERYDAAVEAAAADLRSLRDRLAADVGESEARIFDAHAALICDPALRRQVHERITRDRVNAEFAAEQAFDAFAARLAEVDSEYLRDRAADARDLGRRVVARLLGDAAPGLPRLRPGTVLIADELPPSDTARLDREHVEAILTERGGRTSHSAILAKALGIPAVADLAGICGKLRPGSKLLVDGVSGTVVAAPSHERQELFRRERAAYEQAMAEALAGESQASVTRDGVRIVLLANLGRVREAGDVRAHGLDGVGMFRTEVLFLDHEAPPTLQEHIDAYREVAEKLDGLPLVIRTFDLGGDKHPAFLPIMSEHNPTLGVRGLRFALKQEQLLRTQLAAIVELARDYPARVLFPMVVGGGDLSAAVQVMRSVAQEAGHARLPPVGAMVETPSALFALDEIISRADFLSIGTNDLTQFMLAADRDAVELIDDYSMLHPSVLRAIRMVVERARDAGRPVSVCGEAAGDPVLAPVLVGLGVRELSMSPARSPAVRQVLRNTDASEAAALAAALQACDSLEAVKRRLNETPISAAR